jgi:hypothetical protein
VSLPHARRSSASTLTLDQHRIAKLVRSIAGLLERDVRLVQHLLAGERPQQLVMAAARLVRAREDRIDNLQPACWPQSLVRDTIAGADEAVVGRRVLQCAHDGRANRDNPAAARSRSSNRRGGRLGDAIRLIEWKAPIELRITSRGQARRNRHRRESDAPLPHPVDGVPIEHEARRRRLECGGQTGDRRPYVPQRKRNRHVGILNWSTRSCEASPYVSWRASKTKRDQAWMVEQSVDRGSQQRQAVNRCSERDTVARRQRRWLWPILCADVEVARTEDHRRESEHVGRRQGCACSEPHLDRRAAWHMHAVQARRDDGCVVGHDQIPCAQKVDEPLPRRMRHRAHIVEDQKPGIRGTL